MKNLKGQLNFELLQIPVDMLVNSIIVAMVANANQSSGNKIYHVGSSLRNPLNFFQMHNFIFRYFTKNPWLNKDGMPVIVTKGTVLTTMAAFRMYMNIRYMLPLKVCSHLCNTCFLIFNTQGFDLVLRKFHFIVLSRD